MSFCIVSTARFLKKIPLFPPFIKGEEGGFVLVFPLAPVPDTLDPTCFYFTNIGGTLAGYTSILRHTSPTT